MVHWYSGRNGFMRPGPGGVLTPQNEDGIKYRPKADDLPDHQVCKTCSGKPRANRGWGPEARARAEEKKAATKKRRAEAKMRRHLELAEKKAHL